MTKRRIPTKRTQPTKTANQWRRIDLHLHTPASADYLQPNATYLDLLHQAEARGLDIIAFTDHNTISGYRRLYDEINQLELLERLQRLRPDEADRLREYRRLLAKILVLPGFEFTATFGFHILGLFSPSTPLRHIEHVLLDLDVPANLLDSGQTTVGPTTDVLTAYRVIAEAGGLVIAAHVNSSNGVAMRNFPFGGQTKIAYTQDPHLHALEVTDLEQRGRYTTAGFFNGSKPEYPRRMHCIQGSDAHRLIRDPLNPKNLGIGDRVTEVLLPEITFEALKSLFTSDDFSRTRPFRGSGQAVDFIQMAREEGPSIVQAFHTAATKRGGHLTTIICDVCAMANTNGGTIYIGVSADATENPVGVNNADALVRELSNEIENQITPALECRIDTLQTQGKTVVRLSVPRGGDLPYVIGVNQIYIRDEGETELAVRDEIVRLTLRGRGLEPADSSRQPLSPTEPPVVTAPTTPRPIVSPPLAAPITDTISPPRTGVEIVSSEVRGGTRYYLMRDLRNGNEVSNVTRQSARRLWHYAISEHESGPAEKRTITWQGSLGLLKSIKKGDLPRYDLAQRQPDGQIRIYYGVTPDGVDGLWQTLIDTEDD